VACGAPSCGGDGNPTFIQELTTFDPYVLGDPAEAELFYDPTVTGFGQGGCETCAAAEMKGDWEGFLGLPWADWSKVFLAAPLPQIDGLILALRRQAPAPAGFEKSPLLAPVGDEDRARRIAALYFTGFARRVEPLASFRPFEMDVADRVHPGNPVPLQAAGEQALRRAKVPFLRQRYAFQLLRLRFYRKDWRGVLAFHQENQEALAGPSAALRWRALSYFAGALRRTGQTARANLLFARIHAGWPALAVPAAQDFQPMEEEDWQATLKLAGSVEERVELWRLVGLKLDPLVAMEKIVALDPSSPRLALLAVREINRAESTAASLVPLEKLALRLAAAPVTDRRWVFELVAAHVAALRGDLAATRPLLARAMRARPEDRMVQSQARATLALALSRTWKHPDRAAEDELAEALAGIGDQFGRSARVVAAVRESLAGAYQQRGMCLEADLAGSDRCRPRWANPTFVQSVITRVTTPPTPLDRFLVTTSGYQLPALRKELALSQFTHGDLTAAERSFREPGVSSELLRTDPFVVHVKDCLECDHQRFGEKATWTHASFVTRMIALTAQARQRGDAGAEAAFLLGNGYYNITGVGNARSFLERSHLETFDARTAERWYKRAFDGWHDREHKAQAAWMAAKSELARSLPFRRPEDRDSPLDPLPIPRKWFPIFKTFAHTAYYQEVLAECGNYRRWAE
jgi:hypothetical protein